MLVGLLLAIYAMAAPPPSRGAAWEKILEAPGARDWFSSVWAADSGEWFVGGGEGMARSGPLGVQWEKTSGAVILGIFGQAADDVFAVGTDELILHFDGRTWAREHVGPKPKKRGHGADLLHGFFHADTQLVAFGPSLFLVRRADRTWAAPSAAERDRLISLVARGPAGLAKPPKCDLAGWQWFGPSRGAFHCHDGRSFLFNEGNISPKGQLPKPCTTAFDAMAFGRGELYASCGHGKLWKTGADGWEPVEAPEGQSEIRSISVTESCMFLAGSRAVWRSCAGPPRSTRPGSER
jgi:hypothetical protein